MAHYPVNEPDPDLPDPSSNRADPSLASPGGALREVPRRSGETAEFESDLAELTAKFSSNEGGQLPADLSVDLALEVVLNEIVDQACAATGASAAAVILRRDMEWVCCASMGASAPELGARLSGESGLIAECIRMRQRQRCEDAQVDPRVDAEVCRNLGIRSAIALPLTQDGALLGVFAAFSPWASLFKENVESVLRVFSEYVLSSVAQATGSAAILGQQVTPAPIGEGTAILESSPAEDRPAEDKKKEDKKEKKKVEDEKVDDRKIVEEVPDSAAVVSPAGADAPGFGAGVNLSGSPEESGIEVPLPAVASSHRAITLITWVLAAVILGFAVLLTTIAGERMMGRGSGTHRRSITASTLNGMMKTPNSGAETSSVQPGVNAGVDKIASAGDHSASADLRVPTGGLVVYDNGKEIFREGYLPKAATGSGKQAPKPPANAVEPAGMYELAPGTAESRLIRRVEPDYPGAARSRRIQGEVVLQVLAGHDGAVQKVSLVQGDPVLAEAAIEAVKQWRFKPLIVLQRPVDMQTTVTVTFKLPER